MELGTLAMLYHFNTVLFAEAILPMSIENAMGLPSFRQVQSLIKDQSEVELKVATNDLLVGKIRWQDDVCICILDHYDQPTLIWKQAIVFIKPKA